MEAVDQAGRVWSRRPIVDAANNDTATLAAFVADLDANLASIEVKEETSRALKNESRPTEHQTQSTLDRRVLAELMGIEDALIFSDSLPWFRAFEIRAGANTNARASYLGVPRSEYAEVETRYNQITGITSLLNDDVGRVWETAPRGWE